MTDEITMMENIYMSYQNILVPIDDSPISYAAVEHAEKIAQAFGSHITILSVLAVDPMIGVDFYKTIPSITEYILAAEKNAQGRLDDLQDTLLGHGIQVTTRIARDVSTATAILNVADEINTDLIVMGSHGRTGLKKLVLGSVAQEVLSRCPLPVMIVKQ